MENLRVKEWLEKNKIAAYRGLADPGRKYERAKSATEDLKEKLFSPINPLKDPDITSERRDTNKLERVLSGWKVDSVILDPSCFLTHLSLEDLNKVLISLKSRQNLKILVSSSLYENLKAIKNGNNKNLSEIVNIFQKWMPSYKYEVIEKMVRDIFYDSKYRELLKRLWSMNVGRYIEADNT